VDHRGLWTTDRTPTRGWATLPHRGTRRPTGTVPAGRVVGGWVRRDPGALEGVRGRFGDGGHRERAQGGDQQDHGQRDQRAGQAVAERRGRGAGGWTDHGQQGARRDPATPR